MRYIAIFIFLLLLWNCQQTRQLEKDNSTVEIENTDGFVLDSVLLLSTEANIMKKFGRENVVRDTGYQEDRGEYLMTLLFPKTNKEVEITWHDSVTFSSIHAVKVQHPSSPWRTAEGIHIGTTLNELVELNKRDVEFSGLGWDYGGRVSWLDGSLQSRGIYVVIDASEEAYNSRAALDSLFGEQMISSKSELAKSARLSVTEVTLVREIE